MFLLLRRVRCGVPTPALFVAVLMVGMLPRASAEEVIADDTKRISFFRSYVEPILKARCYDCHSHDAGEAEGGLVLDSRVGWEKGGQLGPAIVPGKPEESLLVAAVGYGDADLQMPPDEPLPAQEVSILRRWIAEGAADPRTASADADGAHDYQAIAPDELWSFQPVINPNPPALSNEQWPLTTTDRFVLAELDKAALTPVAGARAQVLIRRLFLDITGLPPPPKAMATWVQRLEARHRNAFDSGSPQTTGANAQRLSESNPFSVNQEALEELVDKLLNTPQYGERWGRHWLDTARYGESNGNNRNRVLRYAWRYRNWVIDALNDDKPYNRFLSEQLCGDLMPYDSAEQRKQQRIATGFLAIGSKPYYPTIVPLDPEEPDRARYDWAAEQIDATMSGMMGLTVACARCHDHKFDPVPTRDYYALAGIFRSTNPRFGMFYHLFGVGEGQAQLDFLYDWNLLVLNDEILDTIRPLQDQYKALVLEASQFDLRVRHLPNQIAELEAQLPTAQITAAENIRQEITRKRQQLDDAREQRIEVERRKKEIKDAFPFEVDQAMGVEDGEEPADANLRIAGDHARPGPLVPRGFISTVQFHGAPDSINREQSGRVELAQWIAHPNNPLTARVAVNRVWYHLFGRGIVGTLDNFGSSGEAPTHPELIDHMAHLFVHELGWSQKRLIKHLVMSRTYQLSSDESLATDEHFAKDPANTLYWRMSPRRLEAEAIRDSMLAVAGRLDMNRPEGSALTEFEYHADIVTSDVPKALGQISGNHRTIYVPTLRGHRHRLYDLFDYPDDEVVNSARDTSTVPTQALYLMNNPWIMDCADALAARVLDSSTDDAQRLVDLYRLCYGRPPAQAEVEADLQYLREQQSNANETHAWQRLAHTCLISAEFLIRL